MISKGTKWFLFCAVLLAAGLMVFYVVFHFRVSREIADTRSRLDASTENWNRINREKLVLQDEMKARKEALREAQLTLQESEAREKELIEEVEALRLEVDQLRIQAGEEPSK